MKRSTMANSALYETQAELDQLPRLLDESYRTAGAQLLLIHQADWRMSADRWNAGTDVSRAKNKTTG